jgi:predicted RNase H-like HicB family nuclease/DNA-binding XRE family transcriptional regulator
MRYPAIITKEGKSVLAEFPDVPGCQTFAGPGEDIAEAATEALVGWLEACMMGREVPPEPSRRARAGRKTLWVVVPLKLAMKVALRQVRVRAGLTQAALAKRLGVSQPMVAKLEDPDQNITIDTYERAVRALNVLPDIELRPVT